MTKAEREEKFEARVHKEANDAKVAADTAIAEKNNALEVRKAELEAARLKEVAKSEAEAAAVKAKLLAEADGIKQKALAEAEGLKEKAEAMKQYGDAAKMQMELDTLKVLFTQLPEMARAAAEPWSKVGNVTIYGGGKDGASGEMLTGNITKTITQVASGLKDSLGIDLGSVVSSMLAGKLAGKEVGAALDAATKATKNTKSE